MIVQFSRIFYGMKLKDDEVSFVREIFDAGENIYSQDQFGMDIDMIYDFSNITNFFIFITPSSQRIDGNGMKEIKFIKPSPLWDSILQNFCDLYNMTYSQPHWYLTNEVWS